MPGEIAPLSALLLHAYEREQSRAGPPLRTPWHTVAAKQIVFCDSSVGGLALPTSLGCLPSVSSIVALRHVALKKTLSTQQQHSIELWACIWSYSEGCLPKKNENGLVSERNYLEVGFPLTLTSFFNFIFLRKGITLSYNSYDSLSLNNYYTVCSV